MGTWDGDDNGGRTDDTSGIDEIAGIIGGTIMAGGTGSPGDTRSSTGAVGTAGGASIGGMAAREMVAEENAMAPERDADSSPDTFAGAGATDVTDRPSNSDVPGPPPTLIAAEDEDQAAR